MPNNNKIPTESDKIKVSLGPVVALPGWGVGVLAELVVVPLPVEATAVEVVWALTPATVTVKLLAEVVIYSI